MSSLSEGFQGCRVVFWRGLGKVRGLLLPVSFDPTHGNVRAE
jgi:hypothetical protein